MESTSEPLGITSVDFQGAEAVEATGAHRFTVYRKAGTNLHFKVELNRPEPYLGWKLTYNSPADQYTNSWWPGQWEPVHLPPGEQDLTIFARSKRGPDGEAQFGAWVKVITSELTAEEKAACTHPTTKTIEGECWGGASGSSSVEIFTVCTACGETLSKSYEYNN